jgi:hypothetical protein
MFNCNFVQQKLMEMNAKTPKQGGKVKVKKNKPKKK